MVKGQAWGTAPLSTVDHRGAAPMQGQPSDLNIVRKGWYRSTFFLLLGPQNTNKLNIHTVSKELKNKILRDRLVKGCINA